MNRLEITLMNELTTEYVTNKNTCDDLIQKINQTQKLLESLEREYDIAKEKRIKAKQKINEQFYFLVEKENRKETRKTIE